MARAGILYSDVVKAASQLSDSGKSPTVDTVREAMGGTGSKSTIAPMLKRWKLEHRESVEASDAGIPASLLQAVKGIHEALQEEAKLKIAEALRQHQADLDVVRSQEQLALDERQAFAEKNAALNAELKEAGKAIAKLHAEKQVQSVAMAGLEAEKSGMQARLADRALEVAALNQQLTLARTQFDHFQEAVATQRAEEKATHEDEVRRLQQDLAGNRQRLLAQQSTLAQQEMRISQLSSGNAQLEEAARLALDELHGTRSERDQFAYRYKEITAVNQTLASQAEAAQHALLEARIALGAQQKQVELINEQLAQAAGKIDQLDQERLILISERAALEVQVNRPAQNT